MFISLTIRCNRNSHPYKRLIQLFETKTGKHKGTTIVNISETINTNKTNYFNGICSVEFVELQNLVQILLVGGQNKFGLQIYLKQNNNTKHILQNTLEFEDNNKSNSTITTDKYIFVKGYQS